MKNSSCNKLVFAFFVLFSLISVGKSAVDSLKVHNETYFTGFTSLDSLYSISKLGTEIESILSKNSKLLGKTNYGIGVYSLNQNKWYYKRNIKKSLTPASTTKLITTFTLLNQTGKNFNISTEVYHDGKVDSEGNLKGNLYIRGKGDALFSTGDLEMLADKVKNSGIRKIIGNIYADPTFYDEKVERIDYSGDNDVVQATPSITALNIDRNTATIIVSAGTSSGASPNVHILPSSDSHIIINNAKVVTYVPQKKKRSKRKSRGAGFEQNDIKSSLPYQENVAGDFRSMMLLSSAAGIRVSTKMTDDGKQQFIVSGNIKANTTYTYQHLIHNPSLTIAGAFKNRLKAGGITISGNIGVMNRDEADSVKRLFTFVTDFKRPVVDIINIVNKESDNYLAEILYKMIGANSGNNKDNAAGSRILQDSILCSIDSNSCLINDGSGLSRRNFVTVEALVQILISAHHSPFHQEYRNSLSIASVDGTLRKRFKLTPAEGNMHAKTGTLRNASALAGYVKTVDGEDLVFTFIFNGPNVGSYKMIENELGNAISSFKMQEVKPDVLEKK